MFTFAIDRDRLNRHFQKDPVLFAYHIGDLDDFHFPHCQYACVYDRTAKIEDCVLIYTGLQTPAVLAFGLTDQFTGLLEEVLPILPLRFFCHFLERYRDILRSAYAESPLGTHIKMKLESFSPARVPSHLREDNIIRLDATHTRQLLEFYEQNYSTVYFTPRMLESGKFFGYVADGELRAVAGVHVYAPPYHIAVLGSIATAIAHRGKGLATLLTSKLTEELVRERLTVCLNVKADNVPAIRCYESLGFVKVHEYEESLFGQR